MEKRRLTPEEWAKARARWQGCAADGYDWLVSEIAASFGVLMTRQGLRKAALTNAWAKDSTTSASLASSLPAHAGQTLSTTAPQVAEVAQPGGAANGSKEGIRAGGRVASVAGRLKNEDTGLTPRSEEFARQLAVGRCQADAYREAYPKSIRWKPSTVAPKASRLAATGNVRARVQELMATAASANEADVKLVLGRYLAILKADPRDLVEVRVAPCRFCYGTTNRWQFTDGELEDARDRHEEKRQARLDSDQPDIGEFNEKGGGGYTVLKAPNPECPSCGGDGTHRIVLKDSRSYSPGAAALFGGAKQSKDGIEVRTVDRTDALAHVAKHVGFYEADNKVEVDMTVDTTSLDAIYEAAMAKSKLGQDQAKGRMDRLREKGADL